MDTEVTNDMSELDQLQSDYQTAVEHWIEAIRAEAALAAKPHSVEELDAWEAAFFHQEELREKVKLAKLAYEDGLRAKIYQF